MNASYYHFQRTKALNDHFMYNTFIKGKITEHTTTTDIRLLIF